MESVPQDRDLWLVREGSSALARLTAASIELFAEQGYSATSIRQIADRAGVSTAVIYHHHRSKLEILVDIMVRGQRLLDLVADRATADHDDPLIGLARLAHAHVVVSAVNRSTTQVVDSELRQLPPAPRAQVVVTRDAYEHRFTTLLTAAHAAGELPVAPNGVTRIALIQLLSSVSVWFSPHGSLDLEEVTTSLLELALQMLGVPRERIHRLIPGALPETASCLAQLDTAVQQVWAAPVGSQP